MHGGLRAEIDTAAVNDDRPVCLRADSNKVYLAPFSGRHVARLSRVMLPAMGEGKIWLELRIIIIIAHVAQGFVLACAASG